MANDRHLEELQLDLLAGGDTPFQGTNEVSSLAGTKAREAVQALAKQISELSESSYRPVIATPTLSQASKSTGTGGALSTLAGDIGKSSGNFLLKGLTLAPLVSGLLSLFRKEDSDEVAPPVRFSLPAPIRTEAGLAPNGQTVTIDRGAGDRIRPLRQPDTQLSHLANDRNGPQSGSGTLQNITVQVNAMDSRSFLDHSEDIARAVRDAMLHSHSLNDVVNDL